MPRLAEPSGHVFLREGKRGGVWYARYRLPDGRQVASASPRPSRSASRDDCADTPSPVRDRVSIWPLDASRSGVDVTYEGASG